jgi:hypothetical protein
LVALALLAPTQAVYAQTCTITPSVAPPGAGTISPNTPQNVDPGGSVTFTAAPTQEGYRLVYFIVDGVQVPPVNNSYTFNYNPGLNHTIVAFFSNAYTITASVNGAGGVISPAGATPVNYGGSLAVQITPDSGFLVSDVLVDGVSVGAVTLYTFNNVTADHTIVASFTSGTHSLNLLFDQSAYPGKVWLQVQDKSQTFAATYGSGSHITFQNPGEQMSVPVKLSDIGTAGLNVTFSNSAVLFVFYDDPTANDRTAAPDQMVSQQRFMPFELTMTGAAGDGGNLTAINYFTAPLSLKSYSLNPIQHPGNPPLQQTGFGQVTAAQMAAQFAAATGGNPKAVVKTKTGGIARYLGPSNLFNGTNPWPSFLPYTQAIHAAGQSTKIQNTNGFHFPNEPLPLYTFGTDDMIATAGADGSLTITGPITVSVNGTIKPGNPVLPPGGAWTGATFAFSTSTPNDFNNAIYGQVKTDAVSFTGSAWSDFETFTKNTLQDPTKAHDPTTNPSLYDLFADGSGGNAYNTTVNMFIGEVTTGLLGGYFNSDYLVGGTAIKNMASKQWWALNPMVGFAEIQPLHPYYNPYANVIFNRSNNTVYGVPYSDRFGEGPLVNSVTYKTSGGVSYYVNYWVVGVGAPITPNAMSWLLLLMDN